MKSGERKDVLVTGGRHFEHHPLTIRGLVPRIRRVQAISDVDVSTACGVLVAEPQGQYREISALTDGFAKKLFEMGLKICIWPADADARRQALILMEAFPAASQPHDGSSHSGWPWILIDEDVEKLAEVLRTHDPGPSAGNPTILIDDSKDQIPKGHRLALCRAFNDASTLVVRSCQNEKTAEGAYQVFAELNGPISRPNPMPFFCKIATTEATTAGKWTNPLYREYENYRQWAEPFIPFHLRPGLIAERCIVSPFGAAITCHFVDGAVPFDDALQRNYRSSLVFSLFELTLGGLRAHAIGAGKEPDVVFSFIGERVKAEEFGKSAILARRVAKAEEQGFEGTPQELQKCLAIMARGKTSRRGIYHGDLHVGNIVVRHGEAIVIDFGSMSEFGPITADPAMLEASIVFGTSTSTSDAFMKWKDWVDQLYEAPLRPPLPSAGHFRFAWMNRAVRELRHVGSCCGAAEWESLLVLSACLLRCARFSPTECHDTRLDEESELRKAYALVVAQRIYRSIVASGQAQ